MASRRQVAKRRRSDGQEQHKRGGSRQKTWLNAPAEQVLGKGYGHCVDALESKHLHTLKAFIKAKQERVAGIDSSIRDDLHELLNQTTPWYEYGHGTFAGWSIVVEVLPRGL